MSDPCISGGLKSGALGEGKGVKRGCVALILGRDMQNFPKEEKRRKEQSQRD